MSYKERTVYEVASSAAAEVTIQAATVSRIENWKPKAVPVLKIRQGDQEIIFAVAEVDDLLAALSNAAADYLGVE